MTNCIRPAADFLDAVINRFHPPTHLLPGYPLGWRKCSHIRVLPSELSVWTGINGHGKSLFLNQVVLQSAMHGVRTVIASFEMPAAKTLYRMVRQSIVTAKPTTTQIRDSIEFINKYVWMYDYVGRGKTDEMMRMLETAVLEEGCTQIVIDSLMKCGLADDDYNSQKFLVEDLHGFAMRHGVHVHLVAHARKGKDENDMPGKMDISGSGNITNMADNVYCVWRNKGKEQKVNEYLANKQVPPFDVTEKHDAIFECSKSREYGSEAERKYRFWYHAESMQYVDEINGQPTEYFQDEDIPF